MIKLRPSRFPHMGRRCNNNLRSKPEKNHFWCNLCTQYFDKKILRHLTIFSNRFLFTNQGKLLKNLVKLVLWFDKSLPWHKYIHGPKIYFYQISFYCNIVYKNVSCEVGLRLEKKVKERNSK